METLVLFCRICNWPGEADEERCVHCDRWLVVPDPQPPRLPRCRVGNMLSNLWDVTCRTARGQAPSSALEAPLLEALEKWRAFRTLQNLPHVLKAPLDVCLDALLAMHPFIPTREVARLNAAWAELLPAAEMVWELSRATGLVNDNTEAWLTTDDLVTAFDNPED